jgi:hypothetical protein
MPKRTAAEAFGSNSAIVKRPKVEPGRQPGDVIDVEDADGAILIDDD